MTATTLLLTLGMQSSYYSLFINTEFVHQSAAHDQTHPF